MYVKEEEGGGKERERKKSFNLPDFTLPLNVHAKQGTFLKYCKTHKTCKMSCKYFGKFESGKSKQNRLANVGESGESGTFPIKTILANLSTCQKLHFFGEYSNLLNLRASGHSLLTIQNGKI